MKYFLLLLVFGFSCNQTQSKPLFKYNAASGDTLAKIDGKTISEKDFANDLRYRMELFNKDKEIFDFKLAQVKRKLVDHFVNKDPKSKGLDQNTYLEKNVFNKIKVSKQQIEDFIKENKIPAVHVNDQLRKKVEQHIALKDKSKAVDDWIQSQLGGKQVDVFLTEPRRPKFNMPALAGAPTYGKSNAKVTIVEFSDFECPACAGAVPILKKIKKEYPNDVKVVYKHFPLSFHKKAKTAGVAAMCLNEQKSDKFWEFHSYLFENQKKLSVDDLKSYGKKYGVDQAKYEKCIDDKKFQKYVDQDINDGKAIGIYSTPTFFVNGRVVTGALPFEQFKQIIDRELL